MIKRTLEKKIVERMKPNKVMVVLGARRVGKTVLIQEICKNFQRQYLLLNGEDYDTQVLLEKKSISNYRNLLGNNELLVIDEAQVIPDIGAKLKLIVDEIPNIKVLVSGSSSFDLQNQAGEPLVGRSTTFTLFPLSQQELSLNENPLETRQNLETRLIYGSYPEVVTLENNSYRQEYLTEIVSSYLLKDVLSLDGIRNASKIRDLLKLIAFQVGSEVSYEELGKQLGMSKNTVEKYLDILSKVFVVFRLGGFSRNLRNEITKTGKWYFSDLGIRNAIIDNFNPLALRQDVGLLWENYIVSERIKRNNNQLVHSQYYFWRTYDRQEIDLIEDSNQQLQAFEMKWSNRNIKPPLAFRNAYPNASFSTINQENYLDFVL